MTGSTMQKKNYCFNSLRVSIESDEADIIKNFDKIFGRFRATASQKENILYTISIIYSRKNGINSEQKIYYIKRNGEVFFKTSNRSEIVPLLEWDFYKFFIGSQRDFYLIHSSVLSKNGKGYLFPGNSGKGKTTMAMKLLMKEFSYISDEVAIIDPVSLKVYPFPINLCLKEQPEKEFSEFQESFEELVCGYGDEEWSLWCIDPVEISDKIEYYPVNIDYIIFTNYSLSSKSHLDPISKSEAVLGLIKNSLNFAAFKKEGVELLASFVKKASCYRFTAGEMAAIDGLDDFIKQNFLI